VSLRHLDGCARPETLPALGGEPRLLMPNAAGLTWLDAYAKTTSHRNLFQIQLP
jgi:hypothetical protein